MNERNDKGCEKRREGIGPHRSCLFVAGHEGRCAFSFGAALARQNDGPTSCDACGAACEGKAGDVIVLCSRCIGGSLLIGRE